MSSYQLTDRDLDNDTDGENPTIRAARNPNPAVLEALLVCCAAETARHASQERPLRDRRALEACSPNSTVCGAVYGVYESPLTAAIRANLPENVRTLLSAGADPNGISLADLADYSVRFIRGRDAKVDVSCFHKCAPRSQILDAVVARGTSWQTAPLTEQELDERRKGFPRFWTEPNIPGQRLRMTPALTALEVAAGCAREDLLELVRAAGADESSWLADSASLFTRDNPLLNPSALSTSSPVHQAIAAGHPSMLRHLLTSCRHSPNYRPLAAPTVALPPLSFAVSRCDLTNPGVQSCLVELLAHPQLDWHLRTPIFDIHVLHFATARHDPELLSWLAGFLPGGLSAAGTTALGHTLLHVAALPLTASQTVARKPAVARSMHCARTLDSRWLPHALPSPLHTQFAAPGDLGAERPQPMTRTEQEAQKATIKLLLEREALDVRAQDIDGNTALHYLAGTLNVDEETVELVRGMEGGENVWQSVRNRWGLTPQQLWGK